MKKLAIVTVSYNNKQDTLEFLESLKKLDTKGFETNVIVVDNGSTDGSVSAIQKKYPNVVVLQNGTNLGFTGGFNRGMLYAYHWGADYVFIANNDTLIDDKLLLVRLIETADSLLEIGLVAPKIYFAPGYEFYKDKYTVKEKGKVIWYGGGSFDWDNIMSSHRGIDEVDRSKYNKVEKVSFISGCCFLVKKEVLEKVGFILNNRTMYFDERYFAYFEDNDFTARVERAGYQKFYDGRTSIYHKVSRTAGIGSPVSDYYITRNRLYFGMQYAGNRTKAALIRQAMGFLVWGRPPQRQAVWDFLRGKRGAKDNIVYSNFTNTPQLAAGMSEAVNKLARRDTPQLCCGVVYSKEVEYPVKLSIVFSNYNTAELCRKLLESIFEKKSGFNPRTMEVIMLDDCSPTDPESAIKKFLSKIKFFRNTVNKGFTRSYNKLLYLSKGEYVLVMNSDMEMLEDTLAEVVKAADYFKGGAVLGGRLYFPDRSSQDSVYHPPKILGVIKEYFFNIQGAYFMYVPKPEVVTRVEGIVGACMIIPRKVINKVGVLSEDIISYFEDHEYCRRLGRQGIPIYFIPTAKFIHHHGASFKQLGAKTLEIHRQSAIQYYGKFYYILSYFTLLVVQKLTGKKPQGSMELNIPKTNYLQKINNLIKNLNLK